nr:hypothetical protein CFP56_58211 [Quercus suber]
MLEFAIEFDVEVGRGYSDCNDIDDTIVTFTRYISKFDGKLKPLKCSATIPEESEKDKCIVKTGPIDDSDPTSFTEEDKEDATAGVIDGKAARTRSTPFSICCQAARSLLIAGLRTDNEIPNVRSKADDVVVSRPARFHIDCIINTRLKNLGCPKSIVAETIDSASSGLKAITTSPYHDFTSDSILAASQRQLVVLAHARHIEEYSMLIYSARPPARAYAYEARQPQAHLASFLPESGHPNHMATRRKLRQWHARASPFSVYGEHQ